MNAGGEKVMEERDRREIKLHEVFSFRVTKLKGSIKDPEERWDVIRKLEALYVKI